MADHIQPETGEEREASSSGLLLSVDPLEGATNYKLSGDDSGDKDKGGITGEDTSDADGSDSDALGGDDSDASDSDGSDAGDSDSNDGGSDADGTDVSDADGTDTGLDADGMDPLGIAPENADAHDADRTDAK
jgi:hypothetical protein